MDLDLEHISPVGLTAIVLVLSIYFYVHNKKEKSIPRNISVGTVTNINRYPIKGLSPTPLSKITLNNTSSGFPNDRRWALQNSTIQPSNSNPKETTKWLHKSNFLCAFTSIQQLSKFKTTFNNEHLLVYNRTTNKELLQANLSTPSGRTAIESFFEQHIGQQVTLVQGTHFGNTSCGTKKAMDLFPSFI